MSEAHPGIEMMLRHLRRDTQELAGQLLDGRQRAMVWAFLAASLIGRLVECLPEIELTEPFEARALMDEAQELLQSGLEALRKHGGKEGPRSPRSVPGLN